MVNRVKNCECAFYKIAQSCAGHLGGWFYDFHHHSQQPRYSLNMCRPSILFLEVDLKLAHKDRRFLIPLGPSFDFHLKKSTRVICVRVKQFLIKPLGLSPHFIEYINNTQHA